MLGLIFVIVIAFIILFLFFALFFDTFKEHEEKHNYKKKVYKALHYFAEENDFCLLNDIRLYFSIDDEKPYVIDHILFGKNYIYVIFDFYQTGGIYGNREDESLFLKNEKGLVNNIPNPSIYNNIVISSLESALAGERKHLFIPVTVYNSSLLVPSTIRMKTSENMFVSLDELGETILEAEKDSIAVPLSNELTEQLAIMLKERSEAVKKDLKKRKVKNKNKENSNG